MKPRSVWLHELRWPEIEAYLVDQDVVLLPIGATEQHGRHLPLLVDTGWAIGACELAAERTGTLVAPPIHYGWSPHHMGYPGTVTLSAQTLTRLVTDVCQSLIHHGFHHIVLFNGNRIANLAPLEIAAVQLQNVTGARVAVADAGLIARVEVQALCEAADGGLDHAAEAESSFALHWAGEHVDLDQATSAHLTPPVTPVFDYPIELDPGLNGNAVSVYVTPQQHRENTAPDGHVGDLGAARADKGRQMLEAIADNLSVFIGTFRHQAVGEINATPPC